MKIKIKALIVNLAISLGTGGISAIISMNAMKDYQSLNQPPLSPPPMLFPIVWTILFLLMGTSSYLIWTSRKSKMKKAALTIYGLQLIFNFLWSVFFFNAGLHLFAFFWLIALWILIIIMIALFFKVRPAAAWLQLPYVLWTTFAGYLNIMIWFLN
jgi:benzodiazapine receptor